jgi:hypothetical protein
LGAVNAGGNSIPSVLDGSCSNQRRRGFPSDTHLKRGQRLVHGDNESLLSRSSVGMTRARADQVARSPPAVAIQAAFDGDLDHYSR